ncbi:alpha/beta fold hydrolase [Deinococcus sp. KSM4-11]|uniref:alpha/beta fold hydrolase n=1 Tax=Deinococcus sp. KSM4-11 TaxID=2568654 RepID=UPI0010A31BBD|nr:alpha/beta hydrolase [Deinococcus sp. KSM4-11]THF84822.1 alpha/beta fold hydrolase [Deinococcus sp. KSM4-11]
MNVNGTDIHVEEHGQGRPLLMLHGLSANIESMRPEIERLSTLRRVIAVDSRGHGRSARPPAYTLADHVSDVLGVLDALGLDTADLMGTSMGSYIAQGVATRAPQRILKLVLVVPKASGTTSSVARLIGQHAAELEGKSNDEVLAFIGDRMFAPTTPPDIRALREQGAQRDLALGLTLTPEQFQAANRALEGFDFRPALPNVTADTLVISGRHDPLNAPEEGDVIARLVPHARMVVLERSGHLPGLEEPERLFEVIRDFLQQEPAPTA